MKFGPRVQQMSGRRAREDPLIPGLSPDGARDWKEIARSLLVECKSRGLRLQTCIIRFEFHVNLSMGKTSDRHRVPIEKNPNSCNCSLIRMYRVLLANDKVRK